MLSCLVISDSTGRIYKQYDILELHELPGNATQLPDYYVVNGTYYKMKRAERQKPSPAVYSDDWWASTKGEGMACLFFILLISGGGVAFYYNEKEEEEDDKVDANQSTDNSEEGRLFRMV